MSWARIMAPLSGGQSDPSIVASAVALAKPFGAEVALAYAPADVADVMPWMGEGFLGGVQTTALESLREAAAAGEAKARAAAEASGYAKLSFAAMETPVWANIAAESRLSDVVVFNDDSARGRGPLAEYFQQMIADEQRPVLIARDGLKVGGVLALAWDGGKEASRAARLATPLVEKASRVVLLAAPDATSRALDPRRLQAYYAARGIKTEVEVLAASNDVGQALMESALGFGADILVAGAFGQTRLKEFIFGGTTRTLLSADGPSLFLSH